MASWWVKSIAQSLKLNDDEDNSNPDDATKTRSHPDPKSESDPANQNDPLLSPSRSSSSSTPTARGVKEDLSDLTKTLTRQFWGVASFLAPPPEASPPSDSQISDSKPSEPSDHSEANEQFDEDIIAGIRSDFAEISGKVKTGITKLSSNKTVSEFTKIASTLLQFGPEEEESLEQYEVRSAVGVTEEILAFARNIAMHPETWMDFPLQDEDDSDDFELSDAQQEHALAVEHLTPRLSALRIELCPGYMSESSFWKIYFVLLLPRLNKHDAELLSTPQIIEAREMLTVELQKQKKSDVSQSFPAYSREPAASTGLEHLSVPPIVQSEPEPRRTTYTEAGPSYVAADDFVTEKHPIQSTEIQIVDKPVIEEGPINQTNYQHALSGTSNIFDEKYEDDGDDWLKEETPEIDGVSGTNIPIGNDEDVTFSDLEEDDDEVPSNFKKVTSGSDSSKDSRDWVQLSRSSAGLPKDNSVDIRHVGSGQVNSRNPETKESNDWLDVEDIDVM